MGTTERRFSSVMVTSEDEDDGFDTLLSFIGFGRWQVPSVVTVLLIAALYPLQMVGVSLIAPPIPFRCHTDSIIEGINKSSFQLDDDRQMEEDYDNTTTYFSEHCLAPSEQRDDDSVWLITPSNTSLYYTHMKSCPIIEYDTSIFSSSVVSDFHLVCERFNLQALYQVTYTIGAMTGSIIGGHIGDRWGRRKAVQIGGLLYLSGVLTIAFVPIYEVILLMRAVLGFANTSSLVTGWNMVIESSPATARTLVGMLMGLPFSVFVVVLAIVAYLVRSWQNIMLLCSTPVLLLIPLSFIVDESPRWLLQHNQTSQAYDIIQKAVKKNKVTFNGDLKAAVEKIAKRSRDKQPVNLDESLSTSAKCSKVLHEVAEYFRSPGMRVILIVTPIIWFFQNFAYVGLAINANNFSSDNPFLYVALTGVMDASAILLSTPITPFLGRRVMVGGELFIGGVLILVELAIPSDYGWFKWTVVMIGFLLVAGAFQVNFVYAPELFPTRVRATGFALVNTIGNIGLMCAPLITTNLAKVSRWAPGVVFGCSGIIISLLVILLPETNKKPLPETLQDVDDRWRASKMKSKSKAAGIENLAYKYDGDRVDSLEKNGTSCTNGITE